MWCHGGKGKVCGNFSLRTFAMSLFLNCLVLSDDADQMFTVKIVETKNVNILKDLD
jgi:hypothetical protein